jgi:transposase
VDGYAAYKALSRGRRNGDAIRLAFCLAHARRKFVAVYEATKSPFAREAIERIAGVYAIEAEIRGQSAEARLQARKARSQPIMDELKKRLTEVVEQLFSQSPLAEAIRYTLNHWDGLAMFLGDGRVEVDTNTRALDAPDRDGTQLVVLRQRRRRRELGDPRLVGQHCQAQ